jgi:TetR/AcrR family transcriptional regulator, mexJK operon transcriptional repressor
MDQVAALAGVSKQTVYKHFADKESLFTEIVLGVANTADQFIDDPTATLRETQDVERDLMELARRYIAAVMQPHILQMRRLLIAESTRLPELARAYYEKAPERVIRALATSFEALTDRGLLRATDPLLAAGHFAFLVLGAALDKSLVSGNDEAFAAPELDRLAEEGARVFLAAYVVPRRST